MGSGAELQLTIDGLAVMHDEVLIKLVMHDEVLIKLELSRAGARANRLEPRTCCRWPSFSA